MGYDLHITRRAFWADDETEADITLEEWTTYIAHDPEMRLDGFAETPLSSGSVLRYENEGLAVWTAYSEHGKDGAMAWLDFRSGEIIAKSPSDEIIQKMWSIAQALDAAVQGDEGELYGADGKPINDWLDELAPASTGSARSKPWWKFW